MLFKIYGLRVAGDAHVFLIGQTHQSLQRRKEKHVAGARSMFARGSTLPKTLFIMQLLQDGLDIEIAEIDEIEAEPAYARMRDGSRGQAIASEEVNERERFWQVVYLLFQGGPMVIDGKLYS